MLHGGGTDHRCFAHVAPILSDRFDLVTPDLPGHGDRPAPPEATVESVAAALEPRLDATPDHVLLGHSFGGMVAMALAPRLRPAKLILCDTFAVPAADPGSWARIVAMEWGARIVGRARATEMVTREMGLADHGPDAALRASMDHDAAWPLHTMLRAVRRFDGRPHLARIGCPTLLLMAGGNPATDGAGERAARRLADARVEIMPKVSHMQMRDDPEGFAAAVTRFAE